MAAMEGVVMQDQSQQQQQLVPPQPVAVERLNQAVVQQLNLEALKTRATSLFKAISRILEDFDAYARTNTTPKWYFILPPLTHLHVSISICAMICNLLELITSG